MSDVSGPVPIAFCITELDPGGAERALLQLVTRLDRNRWQPVVYCLAGEAELAGELRRHDVPVECLGARGAGSLWVVPRLASLLRKQRPAILQTFLFHANIAGRIAGRMARVPHVVSGIRVAERRSRFRLWLDRWTDRFVERHVCVSEAVAKFSIEQGGLPAEKIVVIPNGVDAELYRTAQPADVTQFGIPAGARVVLFVGRLDQQKGPLDLVEAVRLLVGGRGSRRATEAGEASAQQELRPPNESTPNDGPANDRDLHVLIVGEGPLRGEIEEAVRASNIERLVHLAGRRNDVPQLMKAAACLVLPSRWEGLPNVVLEAMASGLPVVATDVDGTTELLGGGGESGARGWLVPPASPALLAERIDQVVGDPQGRAAVALEAQLYVRSELTWPVFTQAYEQLYLDLLDRQSLASRL